MKKYLKIMLLVGSALPLLSSCYSDSKEELYQNYDKDRQNPCDSTVDVSYTADIAPILQSNCALSGCHVGANPQSGINMSEYSDVRGIVNSGKLVTVISGGLPQMPPGNPLPSSEVSLIESWAEAGACEN